MGKRKKLLCGKRAAAAFLAAGLTLSQGAFWQMPAKALADDYQNWGMVYSDTGAHEADYSYETVDEDQDGKSDYCVITQVKGWWSAQSGGSVDYKSFDFPSEIDSLPVKALKKGGAEFFIDGTGRDNSSNVEVISLPDSIISIGDGVFSGITFNGRLDLPASLKTIGEKAFSNAVFHSPVAFQGDEVELAGEAFSGASFHAATTFPAQTTLKGEGVFHGAAFSEAVLLSGDGDIIPARSFYQAKLEKALTFSGVYSSVGAEAFREAELGGTLKLPNQLKTINSEAFEDVTLHEDLYIPGTVETVANDAFFAYFSNPGIVYAHQKVIQQDKELSKPLHAESLCKGHMENAGDGTQKCSICGYVVEAEPSGQGDSPVVPRTDGEEDTGKGQDAEDSPRSPSQDGDGGETKDPGTETGSGTEGAGTETGSGTEETGTGGDGTDSAEWTDDMGSPFASLDDGDAGKRPGTVLKAESYTDARGNVFSYDVLDLDGDGDGDGINIANLDVTNGSQDIYGTDIIFPDSVEGLPVVSLCKGDQELITGLKYERTVTSIRTFTLPAQVSLIGDSAFYDLSIHCDVSLPESLSVIGTSAFENATFYENFHFPSGQVKLLSRAFAEAYFYQAFQLPANLSYVGGEIFCQAEFVQPVTFSTAGTEVPYGLFYFAWFQKGLELKGNIQKVAPYAFKRTKFQTAFRLPDDVQELGMGAFYYAGCDEGISLPGSLQTIGAHAFECCNSGKDLVVPASVSSIGERAFYITNQISKAKVQAHKNAEGYEENLKDLVEDEQLVDLCEGHMEDEGDGTQKCAICGYVLQSEETGTGDDSEGGTEESGQGDSPVVPRTDGEEDTGKGQDAEDSPRSPSSPSQDDDGTDDAEKKTCTVTLWLNDGSHEQTIQVPYGECFPRPEKPVREGWYFDDWYCDFQVYDFSKPVTRDIILSAKWRQKNEHKVKFESDEYAYIRLPDVMVEDGELLPDPGEPGYAPIYGFGHYRFEGWYQGDTLYDFGKPVTGSIILTAKWTVPIYYLITPPYTLDSCPAGYYQSDNGYYTLVYDQDQSIPAPTGKVYYVDKESNWREAGSGFWFQGLNVNEPIDFSAPAQFTDDMRGKIVTICFHEVVEKNEPDEGDTPGTEPDESGQGDSPVVPRNDGEEDAGKGQDAEDSPRSPSPSQDGEDSPRSPSQDGEENPRSPSQDDGTSTPEPTPKPVPKPEPKPQPDETPEEPDKPGQVEQMDDPEDQDQSGQGDSPVVPRNDEEEDTGKGQDAEDSPRSPSQDAEENPHSPSPFHFPWPVIPAAAAGAGAVLLLFFWWRRRRVKGLVLDKKGRPVQGIYFTLEGADTLDAITDERGGIIFKNMKKGSYLLNAYDRKEKALLSATIDMDAKKEEAVEVLESAAKEFAVEKRGRRLMFKMTL